MKKTPNSPLKLPVRNPAHVDSGKNSSLTKRVGRLFSAFFLCTSSTIQSDAQQRPGQAEEFQYADYNSASSASKSSSTTKNSNSYGSSNATDLLVGPLKISFNEIRKATGNFSLANKIGEGGFGTVYKGKLKDGSFVAIKRAKMVNSDEQSSAEFRNEILTLSNIEHSNLVSFLGYLEHGQEKIIVEEYVSNGTLREHLDGTRGNELEIAERLDIAVDIAHGITYLHTYANPPIIHRDIKASNVLITERLHAKVADFGFARLAIKDSGATHVYTEIKGTAGYMDPEYLKTYELTEKSDVYSFGVLLVEMMTGRHPVEEKRGIKEKVTLTWALKKLKDKEIVIAMDPRIRRSPTTNRAVEKVLRLARECVAPSRHLRPSMKKCLDVLCEIRKELKEKGPCPASTPHRSADIVEKVRTREEGCEIRKELKEKGPCPASTPHRSADMVEKVITREEGDLYKITDSDYHGLFSA